MELSEVRDNKAWYDAFSSTMIQALVATALWGKGLDVLMSFLTNRLPFFTTVCSHICEDGEVHGNGHAESGLYTTLYQHNCTAAYESRQNDTVSDTALKIMRPFAYFPFS